MQRCRLLNIEQGATKKREKKPRRNGAEGGRRRGMPVPPSLLTHNQRMYSGASPWLPKSRPPWRVHGEEKAATVERLEDLSSQSCRWHPVDGFVREPDNLIPPVVWISDPAA